MLEIAVCEDDKYSRIQIVRLLEKCAEIQEIEISVREFENGEKLLREIRAGLGIHLIYMDIEMDGINGLNTAKMIRERDHTVQIIFVTNYETYALEGYKSRPFDYLVKPVDEREFRGTFQEVIEEIRRNEMYFVYESARIQIKLPMKEILYFQSSNKRIEVHMTGGSEQFTAKLDEIEKRLERSEAAFLRIHKSYLVDFLHIVKICGDQVRLTDGTVLRISDKYKSQAGCRYASLVERKKGH